MPTTLRRAEYNDSTEMITIGVTGLSGKTKDRRFRRLLGAVAWGDPTSHNAAHKYHGAVFGGERDTGGFAVLGEFLGPYSPDATERMTPYLVRQLIDWKDEFLVQTYYAEGDPPQQLRGLRDESVNPECDGLTHYAVSGVDSFRQPLYKNPTTRWPLFRTRQTTADVYQLPMRLASDLPGVVSQVNNMIALDQVTMLKDRLPQCRRWLTEPPEDAFKHPLFRALFWLIACWHLRKSPDVTTPSRGDADNPIWW